MVKKEYKKGFRHITESLYSYEVRAKLRLVLLAIFNKSNYKRYSKQYSADYPCCQKCHTQTHIRPHRRVLHGSKHRALHHKYGTE